jgi:hypothetical protein
MGSNEMIVAVAVRRKPLGTLLTLVLRLQRVVFECVSVGPVYVESVLCRIRVCALRTLILGPTRMIGRRTRGNVVLVAGSLLLEFFQTNLAFEVSLVAVLVVLMLWQSAGPFTLVLTLDSVIIDMVTYVVIYMEMYEVNVVLQPIRCLARVTTPLILTLM